jgi:hemoglobin
METTESSLFDRLGGSAAIEAATKLMYDKVLADPSLSPFFAGTDMEQLRAAQATFLAMAFDGPVQYSGPGLRNAHAGLGITDTEFDAVIGYLSASLAELGVSGSVIADVEQVAQSVRGDVVSRR